ncbi:MAG: glycosyltransferase family 2 protein [SAR324 cluster bacterium]|nr:glycosyltransferase family 2 protein [SAR324 cluster bacterium]
MATSFCVVIPTYNHSHCLDRLATEIGGLKLPLFIVDDGSDEETKKTCQAVKAKHSHVQLLTLEQNAGKGNASQRGFELAYEAGFTHAILIDADGQHDVSEMPQFIEAAKANPKALVMGNPIFGPEAPQIRVQGRKVTQFWVHLETLKGGLGDALFGFRCYPLESVTNLSGNFGRGMDFDPEIAVRLYWAGVPIVNLDCKVSYDTTQPSNFDMVGDNLKMIQLHTKLVIETILKFPKVAIRRFTKP